MIKETWQVGGALINTLRKYAALYDCKILYEENPGWLTKTFCDIRNIVIEGDKHSLDKVSRKIYRRSW